MTAPAPRNHPAEDAHPAPTPAPVAVPEAAIEAACREYASIGMSVKSLDAEPPPWQRFRYEMERVLAAAAPLMPAPRPEPVVAPLPSEAGALVLATIGPRTIPLELQATGVWLSPGRHGSYIAADIDSWVRLAPEDDEDTVRVPTKAPDEALNALARLSHEVIASTQRTGASTEAALADVQLVEDALRPPLAVAISDVTAVLR